MKHQSSGNCIVLFHNANYYGAVLHDSNANSVCHDLLAMTLDEMKQLFCFIQDYLEVNIVH